MTPDHQRLENVLRQQIGPITVSYAARLVGLSPLITWRLAQEMPDVHVNKRGLKHEQLFLIEWKGKPAPAAPEPAPEVDSIDYAPTPLAQRIADQMFVDTSGRQAQRILVYYGPKEAAVAWTYERALVAIHNVLQEAS